MTHRDRAGDPSGQRAGRREAALDALWEDRHEAAVLRELRAWLEGGGGGSRGGPIRRRSRGASCRTSPTSCATATATWAVSASPPWPAPSRRATRPSAGSCRAARAVASARTTWAVPTFPAWRKEAEAGRCLDANPALLGAVASQALHVTRREAPARLRPLVEELREVFPPVTGRRPPGPDPARLARPADSQGLRRRERQRGGLKRA